MTYPEYPIHIIYENKRLKKDFPIQLVSFINLVRLTIAKLLKTTCIEAVALRLCLQCALAQKITQTCILQTLFNKHFIEQNITFYTSTWRIKLSEYNGINIKFIHVVRLSDHRILTIICIFYWFELRAF